MNIFFLRERNWRVEIKGEGRWEWKDRHTVWAQFSNINVSGVPSTGGTLRHSLIKKLEKLKHISPSLSLSVLIFFSTLSLFPSVTMSVTSIHKFEKESRISTNRKEEKTKSQTKIEKHLSPFLYNLNLWYLIGHLFQLSFHLPSKLNLFILHHKSTSDILNKIWMIAMRTLPVIQSNKKLNEK